MRTFLPLLLALGLTACSDVALEAGTYTGDIGATPGGAQDIGYARDVIANGGVPQEVDIPIEGLLSEHDLPAEGPPCEDLLCIRPALGTAPSLSTGERAHWVHLAFSSGMPEFERPPTDLVVLIDTSSSMSIDQDEVNQAVSSLVDQMRPEDKLGIVAFASQADVLHPLAEVTDPSSLSDAVLRLNAGGNWNLNAAMDEAAAMHSAAGNNPDRMRRVVLITCGYPSASGTFAAQVNEWASERIGFSTIGILLGWDDAIANLMGQTPGGAMHYTSNLEQTAALFDEELDTMITPLAYNLDLDLELAPAFQIDKVYGLPGESISEGSAEMDVATIFASKRKGAIVARIAPRTGPEGGGGTGVGFLTGSYEPESSHGYSASATDEELVAGATLQDETVHFAGGGVRKAVALVNQGERMREAVSLYHQGDVDLAVTILDELLDYLRDETTHSPALEAEADLISQLRANMTS